MPDKPECSDDKELKENTDLSHLDGVEDGSGCAEIWEKLTEHRSGDSD